MGFRSQSVRGRATRGNDVAEKLHTHVDETCGTRGSSCAARNASPQHSSVKVLPEGFSFEIDLSKMSLTEMQGWAENEQKCCSQLKIDTQIIKTGKRAKVRVVCNEGLKTELMQILAGG